MFIWIILTISLLAGASPKQSPCSKAFSESQTKEQKLFKKTGNPLFNLTEASKDLMDFKSIKDEHFTEAVEFYSEKALNRAEHIKKLPTSFHNTIEPFDNIMKEVEYAFTILMAADLTRDLSDIKAKSYGIYIENNNSLLSDPILFKKVESVYKNKKLKKSLSLEQIHLLKKYIKNLKSAKH